MQTGCTFEEYEIHPLSLDGIDRAKCHEGAVNPDNGNCYLYVGNSITWVLADEDCALRGGYLATVSDREENEFVAALADVPVWIGLSDQDTEGGFRWVTGERVEFVNWATNNPYSENELQDCVRLIEGGQWDDSECDSISGRDNAYVCEFDD